MCYDCQRLDATNNLHDFASDLRLACPVVSHRQLANDLVCVLGGRLHGDHTSNVLADRRVQKALEELHPEAGRVPLPAECSRPRAGTRTAIRCANLALLSPSPSTELNGRSVSITGSCLELDRNFV